MAIITSNADGLWSAGATWIGGVVPVDIDDVVINHDVVFDVDTPAGSSTCSAITINAGKSLKHKVDATTTLRTAPAKVLTNNGTYAIGEISAPIQAPYIGSYLNRMAAATAAMTGGTNSNWSFVGSYNYNMANNGSGEGVYKAYVAVEAAAGTNTVVLDRDLGLRAGGGDTLAFSFLNDASLTGEWARTETRVVASYDSATKTAVLTGNFVNTRRVGCMVCNITRNVVVGCDTVDRFITSGSNISTFTCKYVAVVNSSSSGNFLFTPAVGRLTYEFSSLMALANYSGTYTRSNGYVFRKNRIHSRDCITVGARTVFNITDQINDRLCVFGNDTLGVGYAGTEWNDCEFWNLDNILQSTTWSNLNNCKFYQTAFGFQPGAHELVFTDCYFRNGMFYFVVALGLKSRCVRCTFENINTLRRNDFSTLTLIDCTFITTGGLEGPNNTLLVSGPRILTRRQDTLSTYTIFQNGSLFKVTSGFAGIPAGLFTAVPSGSSMLSRISITTSNIEPANMPRITHTFPATAGLAQAFYVNMWCNGYSTLPVASKVFLKLTSPGNPTPKYSTQQFSANDTWTEFTVSDVPTASGSFTLEICFENYEAVADYIYVDFPKFADASNYDFDDGMPRVGQNYVQSSTAKQVWDYLETDVSRTGSMGVKVKDIKKDTGLIGGLL